MKNKCIQFKNSTEQPNQELYFYGDIVSDEWAKWTDEDTCPQDVLNILSQIDENKPLDIFVNSGGGSVFAGMAIYNMLKRNKCEKTVYIDGLAGSIASVIALVGDKIIMPKNSYLMIHHAFCGCCGNSMDIRKMADTLDKIDEGILEVYKTKMKDDVDIESIKTFIDEAKWFTGVEASNYFDIELTESNEAVAYCGDIINYENIPQNIKAKVENNSKEKEVQNKTELELAIAKLRIKLL